MKFKFLNITILIVILMPLIFSGCNSSKVGGSPEGSTNSSSSQAAIGSSENSSTVSNDGSQVATIDLNSVKPNESGKIMVVMFHRFIDAYQKGDKEYTTTFDSFRSLLNQLYDSGYRLISLNDYLDNNINVPAGRIPIVFTFDDGTEGQFNLVDNNGVLSANSKSAVGVMEEFNKKHPDFGLQGTFYVNLGDQTFSGAGTLAERLKYLVDEGFALGNHTYTHINLKKAKSADEIQKEIGGNQKKVGELIPSYVFKSFSLPYGLPSKALQQYVLKGEFEGVSYDNRAIMEVGWDPAPSPVDAKFNPLSTHRIRASGIKPVDADLAWWLKNLSRDKQYVSDGNADTVAVPKSSEKAVDVSKLNSKKLIVY